MQIDNYSMYSFNADGTSMDKVDIFLNDLQLLSSYEEVVEYLHKTFDKLDSKKIIEYNDLNKQVEIVFKEDAVEVFAAKDWKQYFGQGWRK